MSSLVIKVSNDYKKLNKLFQLKEVDIEYLEDQLREMEELKSTIDRLRKENRNLDGNLSKLSDVLQLGDFSVDVTWDKDIRTGIKKYTVYLRFAYMLMDGVYDYVGIPVKVFDTNDNEYNKGLAEELADKILEDF
jgi:hypothetical protein